MRTTLVLDDRLIEAAKRRALEQKSTLGEVVNEALRLLFQRRTPAAAAVKFSMPTFGEPSAKLHHEPEDFGDEQTRDDLAALKRT